MFKIVYLLNLGREAIKTKWEVRISTTLGSSETPGVSLIFLGLGGDRCYHLLDCCRGSMTSRQCLVHHCDWINRSCDLLERPSASEAGYLGFIRARTSEKSIVVSAGN